MKNVHIYPSAFTHESRILKEAGTLRAMLGMQEIYLVGVATPGLPASEDVGDGIEIRRLGPAKGRGLIKLVRHIIWCVHTLIFCLRLRPSVVNCHSLPVLPIGVLVKALTRARLVYDAHELETETMGSSPRRRRAGRLIEGWCMRFVDLLVVVSPGIEAWYRAHYDIDAAVTVLNAPKLRTAHRTSLLSDNLQLRKGEKVVLYQGVLAQGRGIEALIAASEALESAGYALVLMGYGAMLDEYTRQSRDLPFHIHPPVRPAELLNYTASADIGLCLIEDSCLSYRLSLPNKLFEYALAGIPVVASDLPEIRAVVEDARVGACIPDWSVEAVVETVRRVDAMRGSDLDARLDAVARLFCWEVQEVKLVAAYREHLLESPEASESL